MGRDRQTGGRRDDHRQTAQDSQSAGSSPPVDPLCARGHLGRSSDSGSWNLVLFDSAGTRTHPGQGVPFGRRWDKEIGGGQEEGKTVTETEGRRDRRERGKEREPQRGRSQIFVPPPPRASHWAVGGKEPLDNREWAGSAATPPSPTPSCGSRPRSGLCWSGPHRLRRCPPGDTGRRVPLTCWPVTGGCAGPPYAPPAPELGPGSPKSRNMPWAGCSVGSVSAALVLTHSLLAESFLFMNEKSSG